MYANLQIARAQPAAAGGTANQKMNMILVIEARSQEKVPYKRTNHVHKITVYANIETQAKQSICDRKRVHM